MSTEIRNEMAIILIKKARSILRGWMGKADLATRCVCEPNTISIGHSVSLGTIEDYRVYDSLQARCDGRATQVCVKSVVAKYNRNIVRRSVG